MSRSDVRRWHRKIDDPDLTGDLLLLTIALEQWQVTPADEHTNNAFIRWADEKFGGRQGWVRSTIYGDVPRWVSPSAPCGAPMVRREGPCGSTRGITEYIINAKGERYRQTACSRHGSWLLDLKRDGRRAWEEAGKPEPAPNSGGVLARYFTGIDPAFYRWASPTYKGESEAPPPDTRPTLRLLVGGAS